jgi:hypothetical protein
MPVSLIIVFREAMEAGLIVGIVLAETEGVRRRGGRYRRILGCCLRRGTVQRLRGCRAAAVHRPHSLFRGGGEAAAPNEITFGPAIGKDIGHTTSIVNLYLTRQLGPDQTSQRPDFTRACEPAGTCPRHSRHRWRSTATPARCVACRVSRSSSGLAGPVALGQVAPNRLGLGQAAQIKYELGWLFGTTDASARGTRRWRVDVEIPF